MDSQQVHAFADDTATAKDRDKRDTIELATVEELSSANQSDLASLLAALEHETIAVLAYRYWHERGCPEGSPEEDWFRAEQEIHHKSEVDASFLDPVPVYAWQR